MWEACKGDGESLNGVSGSAGTVEGKVCVITSPAEFYKLKKGDILVCHYIDPEWTPLFAIAGGVIADTGGVLSHAAIVVSFDTCFQRLRCSGVTQSPITVSFFVIRYTVFAKV